MMSTRTWTTIHGGACFLLLVLCTWSCMLDLIIYRRCHRSWPACKKGLRATKTLKFLKMWFLICKVHKWDWEIQQNVPLRSSLNDLQVFQQQEWTCVTHFLFFPRMARSRTLEAVSDWLIRLAEFRMQSTFEVEVTRVNSCVELGG